MAHPWCPKASWASVPQSVKWGQQSPTVIEPPVSPESASGSAGKRRAGGGACLHQRPGFPGRGVDPTRGVSFSSCGTGAQRAPESLRPRVPGGPVGVGAKGGGVGAERSRASICEATWWPHHWLALPTRRGQTLVTFLRRRPEAHSNQPAASRGGGPCPGRTTGVSCPKDLETGNLPARAPVMTPRLVPT